MSGAGPIRSVVLGVSDAERSLRLYRDTLGLAVEADGDASAELLAAWGLAGRRGRLVELSCAGYPVGRLRLLELDRPATEHVRRDLPGEPDAGTDIGPKAIDFYPDKPVAEAALELEAAGYPPRSAPVTHSEGGLESNELLFTGPDGEPFLVMEGSHGPLRGEQRGPYSEIATVSVICGDVEASMRLYGDAFGLVKQVDAEASEDELELIADLVGVPRGTRCRFVVCMEDGEPSGKYLLVHFYEASTRRLTGRMRPGNLGFVLYSHEVDDLDRLASAPGLSVESGPAEVDGRRLMLARGPNEELFELTERG